MSVTLPNTDLSGTIDDTELEANFNALANKFDGNITNADISSSAGIAVTKLAAYTSEVFVTLSYQVYTGATQWSGLSDGDIVAMHPIPGADGDAAWTVTDAMYVCSGTGTSAGTFDVNYGYFNSSSVFQSVDTVIAEESMTVPSSGGVSSGRCTLSGTPSLTNTSNASVLVLQRANTGGTAPLDAVGEYLTVTLRLTRNIQAS